MQYAVIETGGKQYKINKGDTIHVESLGLEAGSQVVFDKVLLVVDTGNVQIGTPYLSGAVVNGKVIDNVRGEKIYVGKFKAKSKYRRLTGHRQSLSQVEIADIALTAKIESKKKETAE